MTWKKLRKKYKMWLTLAFVFMVLMFVMMGLQIDGWIEVCMGATFFCLVMVIYMMLRYGRCRVCYNLLDPYVLFHGGALQVLRYTCGGWGRKKTDISEYAGNDRRRNQCFFAGRLENRL